MCWNVKRHHELPHTVVELEASLSIQLRIYCILFLLNVRYDVLIQFLELPAVKMSVTFIASFCSFTFYFIFRIIYFVATSGMQVLSDSQCINHLNVIY
jgi:hypothetical protein